LGKPIEQAGAQAEAGTAAPCIDFIRKRAARRGWRGWSGEVHRRVPRGLGCASATPRTGTPPLFARGGAVGGRGARPSAQQAKLSW